MQRVLHAARRLMGRRCLLAFLSVAIAGSAARTMRGAQEVGKALTVDRIYSQPSLSGRLTRGIAWKPGSKEISFLVSKHGGAADGAGDAAKEPQTELWIMNVGSGEKRLLLSAEKLETVLPAEEGHSTQATGLGRHAPAQYQWAPSGDALLFQGSKSLAWFDLKTQSARALVSGKEDLADVKISPSEKWVSFVRNHNIWLVSIADGRQRELTRGGTEAIRKGELDWVYPEELDSTTAYWWAPNSSAIAYLQMDERHVAQYPLVDFASYPGDADEERYPPAGEANPDVHVYVMAVSGGEPRAMDTGADTDIYVPRVNWLPDSKHLAIQRLNRAQTVLDMLIADAESGHTRVAVTQRDQYWINVSDDLYFFKDGKRFLWSSERTGYRHFYLYDFDGKELRQITDGNWEVTALEGVDEAMGLIYFNSTEKSPLERHLYRVSLDGSGRTRITKDEGMHGINMAPGLDAYVDTYSNSATPPRQDLYSVDGARVAAINENRIPELAEYHLSPVQFLSVRAHDGMPLNAFMIKPPNFDPTRKYPVLIYTYGGPHAQVVLNAWMGPTFLWHQLMAQKGYIIWALDNRGSAGRGHVFEEPIHFRLGAQELSDQRDGLTYLKSLPYVDSSRIGIWGWSYGGHMTLHAMFDDPKDFKAGFAGGPVTDWHFYDSIYTERYLGLPQKNEESYEESSPIKNAGRLTGKLLIAHGTGDDNVHFANTLSLLNELIEDEKYVEVMPFPGRGHGVSDPPARKVLMRRVTQFFLDNL